MAHFTSWNVNGIRAVHKNGYMTWHLKTRSDVIGFQEVRAEPDQISPEIVNCDGWYGSWFPATKKKGYSGVGILSRVKPIEVQKGMGVAEFDEEGRVITAEFKEVYFISAYFPNSQDAGARIKYKIRFCEKIHEFANSLRQKGKPVIICGDFNIAHQPIDLARPKENEKTAGYLPEEREWFGHFLKSGWVDTFRAQNPDAKEKYSWWSARMRARERNIGWRIDYHTVAEQDRSKIISTGIEMETLGSDHCPVNLEFDAQL